MFNQMRQMYAARIIRVFKQAPWRRQAQTAAVWSMGLLLLAVVGGLYLAVAARSGTAGRDLQNLAVRKAELIQANDELRAQLAVLRSITRLEARARDLGFRPAGADEIEYVAVKNYPAVTAASPAPAADVAVTPASLSDWLLSTLGILTPGG